MSLFNHLKKFIFEPHICVYVCVCMYILTCYLFGLLKTSPTRCWDQLGRFQLQVIGKYHIGLTSEDDWIMEVKLISGEACLSGCNIVIKICRLSISI